MKMRLIATLLMFIAAAPAWAQWKMLTESHRDYLYVLPESIRKDGNLRRIWVIHDFKQAEEGNRSIRSFQEFDCKDKRTRVLQSEYLRGQMGLGERGYGFTTPAAWEYIVPQSLNEAILNFVCSTR